MASDVTRFQPLPQGDDRTILLRASLNGQAVDLTSATLAASFSANGRPVLFASSLDSDPAVRLGDTPSDGRYTLVIDAETSATLPEGTVTVEVKARLADDRVVTLLRGGQLPVQTSTLLGRV